MRTRLLASCARASDFPDIGLAEIAFVGRSNVGKSSLLNGLASAKIARTSKTPGRTQTINFFEVHTGQLTYVLADLPGRGWAKAPTALRAKWGSLIERYLASREPLLAVLFLLDLRRGADEDDVALYGALVDSMSQRRAQTIVVATKSDKLSKAETKPAIMAIARALDVPFEDIVTTSASKRIGLDLLRTRIESITRRARTPSGIRTVARDETLSKPRTDSSAWTKRLKKSGTR